MNSSVKPALGVAVLSCLLTAVACGSGPTLGDPGFTDPNLSSSGASGQSSGEGSSGFGSSGASSGTSGASGGVECAAQEASASLTKRPVDIIFAIDNSGSMSGEIAEVEKQINQNFATLIEASKIDYRVIMIAKHGANSAQRVCVSAPLSGTNCTPPPAVPAETAKFYQHSKFVSSFNALCRIVDSFSKPDDDNKHPTGYGSLLRANASKVIVVITDDRVSTNQPEGCVKPYDDKNTAVGGGEASTAFENDLFALPGAPFGTAAKRNYTFHSIIGLAPFDNADLTKAHPTASPIITGKCTPGSENPGTGYQSLSMKSGGLRYPSCGLNYTTIFQEIAKGVIDGAKVACEFPVPAAPAGQTLDLATVVPRYTPGGGGAGKDFGQIANAAACAADKFYIENGVIKLCKATCDAVQADPKAAIKVSFGCAVKGAN